uniref:USP domain-containing protein n=1 Tax=Oryzias melastigma TaxID=30732 RepID=A0A3B3DPT4_ORYME
THAVPGACLSRGAGSACWCSAILLLAIVANLASLIAEMSGDSGRGPCDPQGLIEALDRTYGTSFGTMQDDAESAFRCIVEALRSSGQEDLKRAGTAWDIPTEIRLACLGCRGTVHSERFESSTLPVYVAADKGIVLQGYIDRHSEMSTKVELSHRCKCCGELTMFEHVCEVASLPGSFLCVKLMRATWHSRMRSEERYVFAESLDVSRLLRRETLDRREALYDLRGVIAHRGTCDLGHYFAYVRRGDSWFVADDEIIQGCSWERVQDSYGGREGAAYMLIYVRR